MAAVVPIETAKKAAVAPKSGGGGYAVLVVAGLGIAAAAGLFFFLKAKDVEAPKSSQNTAAVTATVEATATETATAQPDPGATQEANAAPAPTEKDDDSVDIDDLTDASASASPSQLALGPGPLASGAATGGTTTEPKNKDPKDPVASADDDQLSDAMRKAAGDPTKSGENPQPASDATGPKNVPDQPPQGSISAYVGSVMGAAKGCVAGADEPSRATVTFGSNGSVQSVTVGGWAAGKGAASCIQGALKGGKVGAFSKPSYSFGVTIRP